MEKLREKKRDFYENVSNALLFFSGLSIGLASGETILLNKAPYLVIGTISIIVANILKYKSYLLEKSFED